jgi:hypothetical protein
VKRLAIVAIACGVAVAAPAEWRIDAPAGWAASDQPADELALPGAISTSSVVYRGSGTLAVVAMVVRLDADAEDSIAALERANRTAVRGEQRYDAGEVGGQHVVTQELAGGIVRRRIYAVRGDELHVVDATCQGDCRAALDTLRLDVAPAESVGWLVGRIAAGVVTISLAAWLAARFRRY